MAIQMRNSLVTLYQLFLFAPLRSAFVISFALHGLLAWSFVLITVYPPPANIVVSLQFNQPSDEISDIDKKNIPARQRLTRSRPDGVLARNPSRPATAGAGTNQQPSVDGRLGDAVSDPGGISVAEGASDEIGLPGKSGGIGSGQGTAPSVGRSGQSRRSTGCNGAATGDCADRHSFIYQRFDGISRRCRVLRS